MSSDPGRPVVSFAGVGKRFPIASRRAQARAAVPSRWGEDPTGHRALDDVSFDVHAGEIVGFIGRNGAGKSTVLKLAAGILEPSAGEVRVHGRIAPLIELGLAFHPDLTGWENLPVAAALLGLDAGELDPLVDDIVDFSGIREQMHLPVKHFSTGMVARLGFALATHAPAQALLIDEVLAVGDQAFQERCVRRVRALAAQGMAVLFVSHSLELVVQVCDRAFQIDAGRLVDGGPAAEVASRYVRGMRTLRRSSERQAVIRALTLAHDEVGSGDRISATCDIEVLDASVPLRVRSELTQPSQPDSGSANFDTQPEGVLSRPGVWRLTSAIGPIGTTAGRLDLTVDVVTDGDSRTEPELVDRAVVGFEVVGEEIGPLRVAVDVSWELEPAAAVARADAPRATVDRGAVVWCEGIVKRFTVVPTARIAARDAPEGAVRPVALDDVSLSVGEGEALGLIGSNGAGKSTLLRVLAGITAASRGAHGGRGTMATILELGSGFHGDLTGDENLAFTWRLHGGDASAWPAARESVVAMADIGDVLDQPVKHLSTGMAARLAVAVALELQADVLVIDEALSVGDLEFRDRAVRRLRAMVAAGTTVLFASHDLHLLSTLCNRVVRLDEGRVVADGPRDEVIGASGGIGWAAGTTTADGRVVVGPVRVRPEVLAWNQPFTVEVDVEVVRAVPLAYVELSLRNTLAADDRLRPRTPQQVLDETACVQRFEAGELFAAPGRRTLRAHVAGVPLVNWFDIVISVVAGIDGTVIAEQWRSVSFGAEVDSGKQGASSSLFDVPWTVDPPDEEG